MLKKLFQHDFRALSRILFPIQIGVLAAGLLATVLTRLMTVLGRSTVNGTAVAASSAALGVTMSGVTLLVLAVMASMLVTTVIVCLRFFRNLMGDEGYLTFTLPVSNGQILLSKLFTGVLWSLINLAAVAISGLLFLVFGTADKTLMNPDVLELLRGMFSFTQDGGMPMWLLGLEGVVCGVLCLFAQLMELYFAIVVGGQIAKKHKLLSAIGMYLVINFCVSLVKQVYALFTGGTVGLGLLFCTEDACTFTNTLGTIGIWLMVLYAGLTVGFFFWSRGLLNKKLNLQ